MKSSLPSHTGRTCSGYYAGLDLSIGPDSIQSIAKDYSQAIIIATAEDPRALGTSVNVEDPAPRVRVRQVLKGHDIRKGDVISICQGMGYIDLLPTKHPEVLFFLEGKDGSTWVPAYGYYGIAPQNKDGSFTAEHVRDKPITMDELQKMLK